MYRQNLDQYWTKQAGRLWGMKLDNELKEMGASRSPVHPCVYKRNHPVRGRALFLVYVDEPFFAGQSLVGVTAVKSAVSSKFDLRRAGT